MKKHYYKKYYDTHKEQEKKRTNAYYHEHKEEILAKKRAKRNAEPKKVRLTPTDYELLWKDLLYIVEWKHTGIAMFMHKLENERLKAKEMLKGNELI